MFCGGSAIFIQNEPDPTHRNLQQAQVLDYEAPLFRAQLKKGGKLPAVDAHFTVYFEDAFEFMRQEALAVAVESGEAPVVEFELIGEPESAECRRAQRVPTMYANRTALFGSEEDCLLLDVSETGYAVVSKQRYEKGHVVTATVTYNGGFFSGPATVQSVREMENGDIRYGLRCIPVRTGHGCDLSSGLRRIVEAALSGQGIQPENV